MSTSDELRIKKPIWGLRTGSKIFMRLFSDYAVIGKENVPEPPFLLTINHLAFWDAPAIGGAVDYPTPAFAAKKYRNKPVGLLFYLGIPIWIEQESPDRRALMTALKIIERGYLFAIAPEGGRSKDGVLTPGHEGVAFIATRANIPILPIGLWGTNRIFREARPEVRVVVGKPYSLTEGRARGDRLAEYTDRIMCAIAALLPEKCHGHYAGHPLIAEMAKVVL